jgi:hypothetical protein
MMPDGQGEMMQEGEGEFTPEGEGPPEGFQQGTKLPQEGDAYQQELQHMEPPPPPPGMIEGEQPPQEGGVMDEPGG